MALIHFSLEHGRSLAEAEAKLRQSVADLQKLLGPLAGRVEWSADGRNVLVAGTGFEFKISVDARIVNVEGDIPLIAKLLGSPAIAGIKDVMERTFQKKLKE